MAAFVQQALNSNNAGGVTTITATFPGAVGSGNFIVGCVTYGNIGTNITASMIVDGSSNPATAIIDNDQEAGGPLTTATFYFQNVTSGTTTVKFTPPDTSGPVGIEVQEWSGILKSGNPIRAHGLALAASSTTVRTPTITSTANDGIYACMLGSTTAINEGNASAAGGTGGTYTLRNHDATNGVGSDSSAISTGGSTQGTFTIAQANQFVAGIVAMIPPTQAGGAGLLMMGVGP